MTRAALAIALWLAPHAGAFAPARSAPARRLLAPRASLDETSPEQREMLVKMGYTWDEAKRLVTRK